MILLYSHGQRKLLSRCCTTAGADCRAVLPKELSYANGCLFEFLLGEHAYDEPNLTRGHEVLCITNTRRQQNRNAGSKVLCKF